jgi:hypothetical protein
MSLASNATRLLTQLNGVAAGHPHTLPLRIFGTSSYLVDWGIEAQAIRLKELGMPQPRRFLCSSRPAPVGMAVGRPLFLSFTASGQELRRSASKLLMFIVPHDCISMPQGNLGFALRLGPSLATRVDQIPRHSCHTFAPNPGDMFGSGQPSDTTPSPPKLGRTIRRV